MFGLEAVSVAFIADPCPPVLRRDEGVCCIVASSERCSLACCLCVSSGERGKRGAEERSTYKPHADTSLKMDPFGHAFIAYL